MCIPAEFLKGEQTECLLSSHDSSSPPVHGPHSKDFCQEPFLFSEDTIPSAEEEQRRKEENVKEIIFYFL